MLYTNGKIIIHKTDNIDELKSEIAKVANHLVETRNETHVFEFAEEFEFPAYRMPEGVTFEDFDDVLRPHVAFRAINEDEVFIDRESTVEKRYEFEMEELQDIANEITDLFKEKKEIQGKASVAAKKYKSDLEDNETALAEKVDLHRNGYENRTYRAKIKYDFKEGTKIYLDIDDETTVLKTEKLTADEKKLRIDHRYEAPTQSSLFEADKPDAIIPKPEEKVEEKEKTFVQQLIPDDKEGAAEADDLVI